MAQHNKNIIIIGAGVAGLGLGWGLAQKGYAVTIYDKAAAGRGASWAAAGMLAAILEAEPLEDNLLPFARTAQTLWPEFKDRLEKATGIDIGYRESGTLFVAPNQDAVGLLRQRQNYFAQLGLPVEWCSKSDLRKKEPFLASKVVDALFSPHDHHVDNRALTLALIAACQKAGVTLHENSAVDEIAIKDNAVTGIWVKGAFIACPHIVLCAGAWSGGIKGILPANLPPVFPMKGQLIALQMDVRMPLLRHVVWTPDVYLVPRGDGRLIIGATMEDKGFDANLTGGGLLHLLRETWDVLPSIDELPFLESWAGFRPTSRDDAPILGASGINGLTYATGQHRHGILFTPLLANAVCDYIYKGALPDVAKNFTMQRFFKTA